MIVSIITPNLNQGRHLAECLDSVREQAIPGLVEIEHIVVDGGSGDDSLDILQRRKEHELKWMSGPDGGQSDAINKGLAAARGDILAYLCADDLYESGAVAAVARVFMAFPDVDVVYGDFYFMEGASRWKRLKKAGAFSEQRLRQKNFLGQPAVFWRRRIYEQFGGFDESLRYCMDHDYWLRINGKARWHYLPEGLATCRLHGGSKTGSEIVAMWDEAARMGDRYGVGRVLRRQAWWMRHGGQWYYRAKREFFKWFGIWLMNWKRK